MKLLKLGVYPSKYLDSFYAARPRLADERYAAQHAAIIGDCFGSSDFWTYALQQLNYETTELIANARPLQMRWATESGYEVDETTWVFDIAAGQIADFAPDVLLIADYSTFSADFIRSVRDRVPSIRLVLGWCGAPYHDASVFDEWDVALSCVPELVADFRQKGMAAHHVNHAFDRRVLDRVVVDDKPLIDFSFTGSIVKSNDFHIGRDRLIDHLVKHTDLEIWSDGRVADKSMWTRLFGRKGLVHPAVYGLAMYQVLRSSRVTLNNHIDISASSASNMRLFEATGVGTCLLTDWKPNITELFEPDTEVLTYRTAEECVEKLHYILDHERGRREIANAGQQRTFERHNFVDRAARVDEIIRGALK